MIHIPGQGEWIWKHFGCVDDRVSRVSEGGKTHSECGCMVPSPRVPDHINGRNWATHPALAPPAAWVYIQCNQLLHCSSCRAFSSMMDRALKLEGLRNHPFFGCFCQVFCHSNEKSNWRTTWPGSLILLSVHHHGCAGSRQRNDTARHSSLPSGSSKRDDLTLGDSYLLSPVTGRKQNSSEVERAWERNSTFANTQGAIRSQCTKGFQWTWPPKPFPGMVLKT